MSKGIEILMRKKKELSKRKFKQKKKDKKYNRILFSTKTLRPRSFLVSCNKQ